MRITLDRPGSANSISAYRPGVVTIATMMGMVVLADRGVRLVRLGNLERYAHALAGAAILGSGLAIRFLGL